jgi:hypothetical protein
MSLPRSRQWSKLFYGLFLKFLFVLVPPSLRVNDATFVQVAACSLTPYLAYILSYIVFYQYPHYRATSWMLLAYSMVPVAIWIFKRHEPPAIIFLAVQMLASLYLVYFRFSPKYAFLTSAVSVPMVRDFLSFIGNSIVFDIFSVGCVCSTGA